MGRITNQSLTLSESSLYDAPEPFELPVLYTSKSGRLRGWVDILGDKWIEF